MTDNHFLTYQTFNDKFLLAELTELFRSNGIEFLLEDISASFDPSFANNELDKEFRVKLRKQDFEQADKLLLDISAKQLQDVEEDHYLFDFSDEELMEVLTKSDEWSKLDYLLARKILEDRGREVNDDLIEELKKQRIEELAKPEPSQGAWVMAGYIFALLGGLLGVFIGWHLGSHKKTLPNGERAYGYSIEDRKHGNRIFVLGMVSFLAWTMIKFWARD
jgi:hypothetical protein